MGSNIGVGKGHSISPRVHARTRNRKETDRSIYILQNMLTTNKRPTSNACPAVERQNSPSTEVSINLRNVIPPPLTIPKTSPSTSVAFARMWPRGSMRRPASDICCLAQRRSTATDRHPFRFSVSLFFWKKDLAQLSDNRKSPPGTDNLQPDPIHKAGHDADHGFAWR